jgi:uncharacterized protein (TIGR02145 family)
MIWRNSHLIILYSILGFTLIIFNSCEEKKNNLLDLNTIPNQNPAIIFNSNLNYGELTDIDGNSYKTITIGNQTWMAENLKVTKYRNGDVIPNITDANQWGGLTTGAYCDFNNVPSNCIVYGKLYNGYVIIDNRNIAPLGWHVPTDAEWETLTTFLGGLCFAGGKLKETGTDHWISPNIEASNESGFTAIPNKLRSYNGFFFSDGEMGVWWSSTLNFSTLQGRSLSNNNPCIGYSDLSKVYGHSIRCIKD